MTDDKLTTSRPRLPNLVIGGVGKAGTSSLFRYLSQHPEICGSRRKEVRYFSALRYGESLPPVEEYASYFEHCGCERYVMEATPGYFFGGKQLIASLDTLLEEARVIVILRDPVTRFWSYYNFQRSRGGIDVDLSFDEYLDTCQDLRLSGEDEAKENNPYWALSSGFYADYIEDWYELLGARFRVEFFEHMVQRPSDVVRAVFEWLYLDPGTAEEIDYSPVNPTVQYRNAVAREFMAQVSLKVRPWLAPRPRLRKGLRAAYLRLNRDPKKDLTLTPAARTRLQDVYGEANKRLAQQLRGRGDVELPNWLASALT